MKANPRYWVHVLNRRLPIVLPDAQWRRYWDFFVLALVVWTAIIVPFEVGFGRIHWVGDYASERFIDAVFWVDISINFRTAYIDHTATTIRDGGEIASHYIRCALCRLSPAPMQRGASNSLSDSSRPLAERAHDRRLYVRIA
jgi:hypothetical protein